MKIKIDNKKIRKAVLVIILGFVVIILGLFIFHRIKLAFDKKYITEQGYYNLVSVGDHSLNVMEFGNKEGEQIILLSGMGAAFPVDIRKMTKELEEDYHFIYVARAGWDGSEDVKDSRSVDIIVDEYRKALIGAGYEAPYILMSHSMGGTYASYWVSEYPEEVSAFVNIDGTYVEAFEEKDMVEGTSGNGLLKLAVNLGLGDILFPILYERDEKLSDDEWKTYCILQLMSISSNGVNQEGNVIKRNRNETWNALKETDVPKLYISSRDGFRTKEDIIDGPGLDDWDLNYYTPDFTGSEEERKEEAIRKWLAECEENRENELVPYLDRMGNYEIAYLPGNHFIYKTEPEKCEQIIEDFLREIEQ